MTPTTTARADRDAATLARLSQGMQVRYDRGCYVVTFPDGRENRWLDDVPESRLRLYVYDGQACAAILAYRKASPTSERSQAAEKDER